MKAHRLNEESGLLKLLKARLSAGEIPDSVRPKPEHSIGLKDKAARASADWNNSDPFAYGRTYLHVQQGYVEPHELIKELTQRTLARKAARVKEVEDAKSKSEAN